MQPGFFKTDINEQEFRDHARANYQRGTPVDPEGIRHPVWVHEAATMNLEAWQLYRDYTEATNKEEE